MAKLLKLADGQYIAVLIAFMLGTAGRTAAVLDLSLPQIDLPRQLINLNPEGMEQTKKYRPTVKLPNQLKEYIAFRKATNELEPLICYRGNSVVSVKTAWNRFRAASKLSGNVQTYSFRHTVARWLRMQSVPAWEVASQLGRKTPEYSTTEIYAPYDPEHLSQAVRAIDNFLDQVACELRVKTISEFLLKGP
ncbi:MAG: tyrosine-type recombinase/integrase [Pseudomonadota bacterium]